MNKQSKIYIAGHTGLVGSALLRNLQSKGYSSFVVAGHKELDLTNQSAVNHFFEKEKPEYVFLAAARVGGIMANLRYRADFIYQNLMIQNNVVDAAYRNGVKKLLFLGSTCIYPKNAPQPIPENALLTSPLEYTNEPYAIAKIAGIKLCESYNIQYGTNYIAVMPANLYGPNDNFDLETSHVIPAIIRKIHLAYCLENDDRELLTADLNRRPIKGITGNADMEEIHNTLSYFGIRKDSVTLWGTGTPFREFLWSEEMADASVYIMEHVDFKDLCSQGDEIRNTHINIGTGKENTIRSIAEQVKRVVGYRGNIVYDDSKPDGTERKLTDVTKLHSLGWHHHIEIEEGLGKLYKWYLQELKEYVR